MPYWRLSSFYFFQFAAVGALVPYWGLYLRSLDFSAQDIGLMMALLTAQRAVAPNVAGWFADYRPAPMRVVRVCAFLAAAAFTGVYFGTAFAWLAVVTMVFSFFWNAWSPLLEAVTLSHLGTRLSAYGYVRFWGSIGFIVAVALIGPILDRQGTAALLPILSGLLISIWLFSLSVPDARPALSSAPPSVRFSKVITRPDVALFLLCCFLMQASHGPYYTFYSIYLRGHGYTQGTIGLLWAFAVICEVGVFLALRPLLRGFTLRSLFLASFALAALRWGLIGYFPNQPGVLAAAQALHAATFGMFHATALQMVHRFFSGRTQHRGQALYSSVSYGAGGTLGSLGSGYVWETLGPTGTFVSAAGLAAAGLMLALVGIRPKS